MLAWGEPVELMGLRRVEDLPQTSALTQLLLKHWDEDTDIDDILVKWVGI